MQVPHDAAPREYAKHVVGDVDLVPEEPLPRRAGIVMVIVVPAFAERQDREPEVVAAVVAGREATRSDGVSDRIDRVSAVVENHGRDEEAPDEELRPIGTERGSKPAENAVDAARRVMLDGAGPIDILPQLAILGALTLVLLTLSAKIFRWH